MPLSSRVSLRETYTLIRAVCVLDETGKEVARVSIDLE
jgi:hypothetical protein